MFKFRYEFRKKISIAGVFNNLSLNGKSGSVIVLYAGDIALSNELGAPTIAEAISGISDKDASEIMYDAEHLVTIADAIDEINEDIESEITTEEIDEIFDEVFGGDE